MSPSEERKLDEALALLREQSERLTAVEARLSNLEVDQRLIREAYQEQGKQVALILERCQANSLCLSPSEVEDLDLDGPPTKP